MIENDTQIKRKLIKSESFIQGRSYDACLLNINMGNPVNYLFAKTAQIFAFKRLLNSKSFLFGINSL